MGLIKTDHEQTGVIDCNSFITLFANAIFQCKFETLCLSFLKWLCKVKVQKITANSQTHLVSIQIESYLDSLNLHRILLSFIVRLASRIDKNSEIQKKSVNLFPDHKRWKNICMKYICITKHMHCFTISKYTKSFLITKLTTDNWSKP